MSSPTAGLATAFRRSPGSRIAMSPWSQDAANPVALAVLEVRAAGLHVIVSTVRRRDRSWMVRVNHETYRDRRVSLVGKGPLEAVVAGALDDYEATHLYSSDELLTIQKQSQGMG